MSEGSPAPFRLVATDLDGTLLRTDHTVSRRTRDALGRAVAAGAAHLVVTGRTVPVARRILDDLDYRGLAVCAQGSQLYHAGERRLLTSVTLDRQVAGLALAKIEAETGPLFLAAARDGLDGSVMFGPGYALGFDETQIDRFTERDEVWAQPISKLYIQHPGLGDDELAAAAKAAAGELVNVTMAGAGLVELLPLGLTKATGLSLAARRFGVKAAETIAFGDMPNDVAMFGWAAHGVAMGNAHPELRAVADEVTASNDEDGIALVLERLFGS